MSESESENFVVASDQENEHDQSINNRRSLAWKYFIRKDEENCTAECKQCHGVLSYRSTSSNLIRHLRLKHGYKTNPRPRDTENESSNDSDKSDYESKRQPEDSSSTGNVVWKFFRPANDLLRIAQCLICKGKFSYKGSTHDLKRHMKSKHPQIDLEKNVIVVSNGREIFEVDRNLKSEMNNDDNNQTNTVEDIVYLEEFVEENDEVKDIEMLKRKLSDDKPRKSIKTERHTVKKKIRLVENDTDDESDAVRKKKKSSGTFDSNDYFGQYLVSLLKQLPVELANELQANIVKQVVTAQLTYRKNLETVSVPRSEYSITISGVKHANDESTVPNVVKEKS